MNYVERGAVYNSILWDGPQSIDLANTRPLTRVRVSYSNIQSGFEGEGNINADPLFLDPNNGGFRFHPHSPCIDSASTTGAATDIEGNPRPIDVKGVGRDGPGAFDMGAYEQQFQRIDLNQDRAVDPLDLFILGGDWMKVSDVSRR